MNQTKIRVLVLNEPEPMNGVTWWRMYRPLALLAQQFPDLSIRYNRGQILPADLLNTDVALAFRPCNLAQVAVLQAAKDAGCRIVLDYDDDLINIPTEHGAYAGLHDAPRHVKAAIDLADVVWCSTHALKNVLSGKKPNPNTQFVVMPNAILETDLPATANRIGRVAAWRGSVLGFYDMWRCEKRFEEIRNASTQFHWIGYRPPFIVSPKVGTTELFHHWDNRVTTHFQRLKSLQINVLWKPLHRVEFNNSKSNIAWIEATVAGGVCLTDTWRQKEQPQWAFCLSEMTYQEDFLREVWRKSALNIRENYLLPNINNLRYTALAGYYVKDVL